MLASRALAASARRVPRRRPALGAAPRAPLRTSAVRRGDGGGGPPPPPFAQTKPPSGRLVEEHELIWDDGVAAETALDFDAVHVTNGLPWFAAGFGFFAGLATLISFYNPVGCNRVGPRVDLVDPVALIKGDDGEEE